MKKYSAFILLFLFSLIFVSCEKEFETTRLPVETDMEIKSEVIQTGLEKGLIVLNDKKEFQELYDFVFKNQYESELIFEFIRNKYSMQSMREIYDKHIESQEVESWDKILQKYPNVFIEKEFDNSTFYDFPVPNLISYLVNEDGLLIIEDKLLYVNKDGSFVYKIELESKELKDKEFISFTPYSYNSGEADKAEHFSYKTEYFSNSRRIVARLYKYAINYPGIGVFYEYDARTTAQRRIAWTGWIQRRIEEIGLRHEWGSITYEYGFNVELVEPKAYWETDRANIRITLAKTPSIYPILDGPSTLEITHWGIWDGYGEKEIPDNELFR